MGGRGGVSFVSQGDGSVVGAVRNDDDFQGRYFKLLFPSAAPRCHDGDGFSDPTGTGGDENVAAFPGLDAVYHVLGTQTILAPTMDYSASGGAQLLAGLDQAAGDGVEWLFGGGLAAANNPLALTIGSGVAQFLKMVQVPGTVANLAELAVGFRKAEDFQALLDSYTDFAVLNLQGGDVFVETNLNSGGTVSVDTGVNIADAESFTFEVRVRADGQARFFVNGTKYGPAFQFDSGDVVLPIVHFLQVTGGCSLGWTQAEGGGLWHVRRDPLVQAVTAPAV